MDAGKLEMKLKVDTSELDEALEKAQLIPRKWWQKKKFMAFLGGVISLVASLLAAKLGVPAEVIGKFIVAAAVLGISFIGGESAVDIARSGNKK